MLAFTTENKQLILSILKTIIMYIQENWYLVKNPYLWVAVE